MVLIQVLKNQNVWLHESRSRCDYFWLKILFPALICNSQRNFNISPAIVVYQYVSMIRIMQTIMLNPIMETAGTNQF